MVNLSRADIDYQAFYCEENVWRLLAGNKLGEVKAWAVVVSNPSRSVVFLRQRAGRPVDGLIHWDYHLFVVADIPKLGKVAIDLDSDLPFFYPLSRYLEDSFPVDVQKGSRPRFRIIKGSDFAADFVSDRSHMRRADGSWLAVPPPWPAPGEGSGRPSQVLSLSDMGRPAPGRIYDSARMAAFAAR